MHAYTFPSRLLVPTTCLALTTFVSGDLPPWWSERPQPSRRRSQPGQRQQSGSAEHWPGEVHGQACPGRPGRHQRSACRCNRGPAYRQSGPILDFAVPDPKPAPWQELQHSALLVGQLKAISAPFYDVLHGVAPLWVDHESSTAAELGQLQLNGTKDSGDSANYYPWTSDTGDDRNRAIATIGQLKAVFSLRFDADRDNDGIRTCGRPFGSVPPEPVPTTIRTVTGSPTFRNTNTEPTRGRRTIPAQSTLRSSRPPCGC